MTEEFRIACHGDLYGGHWLVIRRRDRRVVHSAAYPSSAARWLSVWGTTLGRNKAGRPLSPRFPDGP